MISLSYETAHSFLEATGIYCVDSHKLKAKWNFYEMLDTVTGIGQDRSSRAFSVFAPPGLAPRWRLCLLDSSKRAGWAVALPEFESQALCC